MNKIYYIAKKIHKGNSEDKKVSRPITKIAGQSIIIAMIVNIITIAVVTGFQSKVKNKVIGFGSHATIVKLGEDNVFETSPIIYNDSLIDSILGIKGVKKVQPFAYKPALMQSEPDTAYYSMHEVDTFQIQQEIHGVIMKGVGKKYDWSFFNSHLIEGKVPNVSDSIPHNEIIISTEIANNLNLQVGEKVNIFFVKASPIKLKYTITGIFQTGLQEFDNQIIIGDIRNVQRLNDWGIQTAIRIADTVTQQGQFVIHADPIGGNGNYRHNWGKGWKTFKGFIYCPMKDTTLQLITSDFTNFVDGFGENTSLPDTAYLRIDVEGNNYQRCFPAETEMGKMKKEYLNESGTKFAVQLKNGKKITFEYIDGKGSYENYVGGYEVTIADFNQLKSIITSIKKALYFNNINDVQYRVRTIKEDQQAIFLWLDFLDINVIIILVLMLLIGTINMGSGLLVIIITKTQLIGLLKALGTKNWDVRKLFLYQAFFIIIRGVIIGNGIGIGLCLLQQYFSIIPLNPEVYYLDTVPIELNFWSLFFLNIGTIVICIATLVIPSYVVTKISPIKALKFD